MKRKNNIEVLPVFDAGGGSTGRYKAFKRTAQGTEEYGCFKYNDGFETALAVVEHLALTIVNSQGETLNDDDEALKPCCICGDPTQARLKIHNKEYANSIVLCTKCLTLGHDRQAFINDDEYLTEIMDEERETTDDGPHGP